MEALVASQREEKRHGVSEMINISTERVLALGISIANPVCRMNDDGEDGIGVDIAVYGLG
jgi:hypothetical protein